MPIDITPRGPFATREAELTVLRKKTPKYRVPFPDLYIERRSPTCSNRIVAFKSPPKTKPQGFKGDRR